MRPTRPFPVVVTIVISALVAWGGQQLLVQSGQPSIVPPWSLAVSILLIAAVELVLAWFVHRRVMARERAAVQRRRGQEPDRPERPPIDPFFAVRVLALAKACSIVGQLTVGICSGLLAFAVTPPAAPSSAVVVPTALVGVAGAILLGAGLLAEYWCRLPPGDGMPGQGEDGADGGGHGAAAGATGRLADR